MCESDTSYAVCSADNCGHSMPFCSRTIQEKIKWNPIQDDSEILPEKQYCEKCGSKLIFYCPHCKQSLFDIPEAKYCGRCAKKIIKGKYDHLTEPLDTEEDKGLK